MCSDRQGPASRGSAQTPRGNDSRKNQNRRRQLALIGLAAAMALPMTAGQLSLLYARQPRSAATVDLAANQPASSIAPASAADESRTAGQLLHRGVAELKEQKYEEAERTLAGVQTAGMSNRDRDLVIAATSEAKKGADECRNAREQLRMGERAAQQNRPLEAAQHFKSAANNRFADPGTRAAAQRQAAVPSAARTNVINAAQAPDDIAGEQLTGEQYYKRARAEYNKGDWKAARRDFEAAQAAGYKPGLFEGDSPSTYLARMDKKEQADASRGARAPAPAAAQPSVSPPVAAADTGTAPSGSDPGARAVAGGSGGTAQSDLQAAVQLQEIQRQQNRYKAQLLVEQADKARAAEQDNQAENLYTQALDLDPDNQAARQGRADVRSRLGISSEPTRTLSRTEEQIRAAKQEIEYRFKTAIGKSREAIARADFGQAATQLDTARVASATNTAIFPDAELEQFRTTIQTVQNELDTARTAKEAELISQRKNEEAKQIRTTQERVNRERRATVSDLIRTSRRLTDEGRYREALGVVDQILVLDPQNEYAIGVRPLIQDRLQLHEQRTFRERFDRELTNQLNDAAERMIPYGDILRYPDDWPDISQIREETVAQERGDRSEDRQIQAQLDRQLPDLQFDAVGFNDAIEYLREVSGANIFINWKALEAAGLDRNAPVTARLKNVKFAKALDVVLESVSGGTTKLGYSIDNGVITISTGDDLSKNTVTRVYDIRDLVIEIPDFSEAPSFDLNSTSTSSRSGGGSGGTGGGGGGGGNLFGGGGGGGGGGGNNKETETKTRQELVEEITKLLTDTIDPESWRDAGGSVGSIKELSGQLIVTQTPENHRRLVALLEQLRERRSIQVNVEARFLTVQRNFLEDVGVDVDFAFNLKATPGTGGTGFGPISVSNGTSDFTKNLQTGVPGSIGATATGLNTSVAFLDDFQVNLLLRATQAARTSTLVTAPRITLFNGQRAFVFVETQKAYVSGVTSQVATAAVGITPQIDIINSGVVLDVQATVSSDRKYVTMTLRPTLTSLLGITEFSFQSGTTNRNAQVDQNGVPIVTDSSTQSVTIQQPEIQITNIRTTVSVPDGGTLLLGGETIAGEIEKEAGVPILSKVPFLKRLFTNRSMAKDENVLLILVKPTIIIQKEYEAKQFPLLSTKLAR